MSQTVAQASDLTHGIVCACPPAVRTKPRPTGFSQRVPGLDCDRPLMLWHDCCRRHSHVSCKAHREDQCVPCSWRYRRLLYRVAEAGTRKATGLHFLTLTAPGNRQHCKKPGCSSPSCLHEICPCTPAEGVELSTWNAEAGQKWNRLRTQLRRDFPDLEFMRVVEVQDRGALHLHVIVRSEAELDPAYIRRLAMAYGFGHSTDLAPFREEHRRYVGKYVVKSATVREYVPWARDRVDQDSGEIITTTKPTYRTWSQSRGFSLTVKEIRAAIAGQRERSRLSREAACDESPGPTRLQEVSDDGTRWGPPTAAVPLT